MRIIQKNIISIFVSYCPGNPYQDELAKYLGSQGVKVEKVDFLKTVFNRILFRCYKPDILHLHWIQSFVNLKLVSLLRLVAFTCRLAIIRALGVRIVWTVHNLVPHEARYPKVDCLIRILVGRLAHALITHTKSARQEVVCTWHLRHRQKVFIIPHGNYIGCYENKIDRTTARNQLGIRNSKIVILFLGGIRPYKGVLQLIDAFKVLGDERTHLVIAGRPLNDQFTSAIRGKIQGCDNIKFVQGFIAENQIQVYMNASDIVVFPYRQILSSGAVILAMSFGRPCVAPALGCFRDILDASGAFLYDPNSGKGLVGAMSRATERRADLQHMGEHNRKLAEQWGWDSIAEMTLDVYRRCLCR